MLGSQFDLSAERGALGLTGQMLGISHATERGGLLDGLFDCLKAFAGRLLDPAEQFLLFSLNVLEIVVRQLRPFLFQLTLGDVPVAFNFECAHGLKLRACPAFGHGVKPYRGRWQTEALPP